MFDIWLNIFVLCSVVENIYLLNIAVNLNIGIRMRKRACVRDPVVRGQKEFLRTRTMVAGCCAALVRS